jgi:hypothetical protein
VNAVAGLGENEGRSESSSRRAGRGSKHARENEGRQVESKIPQLNVGVSTFSFNDTFFTT